MIDPWADLFGGKKGRKGKRRRKGKTLAQDLHALRKRLHAARKTRTKHAKERAAMAKERNDLANERDKAAALRKVERERRKARREAARKAAAARRQASLASRQPVVQRVPATVIPGPGSGPAPVCGQPTDDGTPCQRLTGPGGCGVTHAQVRRVAGGRRP